MARRVTGQWMACVLVLAVGVWHGAIENACLAASLPLVDAAAGEEDVPDMNHVKSMAEAGRPNAQTQFADYLLASADFTNAVSWYRRAADQNHVPAQLSLAGCLMAGRGAAKDPAGAARLLRRAADLIEFGPSTPIPPSPAVVAKTVTRVEAKSIVITREATPVKATARIAPAPKTGFVTTNSSPTTTASANPLRVGRVDTLAAVEPVLQEARPASGLSDRLSPP